MTSYADTGFLVKLYLLEPESAQAAAIIQKAKRPNLLSYLSVLELRNAFLLNLFQKRISETTQRAAWKAFKTDLEDGIYAVLPLANAEHYDKAGELADRYTAAEGSRSLDLLHVAAALLFGAGELLSYDARQRKVAVCEGLKVRP